MLFRKNSQGKRKPLKKQLFLVLLSFLVIFSSGIFLGSTEAEVISAGPELTQVGPINESNGFPFWYKDSKGVKQELCLDTENGMCGLVSEGAFNADEPIKFPTNYPGEAFYQLAEAAMESEDGKSDAIGTFALEATFNAENPNPGDQTVFARIRFRIDSLTNGEKYTITHPYGVDEFIAVDNEINYVEDIGAGQGFDAAMKGRIGTFLKAVSPAPPTGYSGNPNVDQTVTGGVNDQNYFRIEGPGIGNAYPTFKCETNSNNCIETKLFSLAGKISTNNGLDIQQATYSQTPEGGAIDVFVSSEVEQNIEVSGAGIVNTALAGGNGQYFAHVPYTGTEPPAQVTLTNTSDNPDTKKEIELTDRIIATTADYDTDNQTLTITAKSSDEVDPPTLTVKGFEKTVPASEPLVISNLSYIPPTITITSSKKGTVTIPVNINSVPVQLTPVVANAGVDQNNVTSGERVALNGSVSPDVPIDATYPYTYLWEQISGPVNVELSSSTDDPKKATFTAPPTAGEYVFKLTVTGRYVSSTSTTKVTVVHTEAPAVTANAGPDQENIKQGTVVTLDGFGSANAATYSWEQISSGQRVTLNSANTATPKFTFPKHPGSLEFKLTVTGHDGKTATDNVTISTVPDNLTVTAAEYRERDRSWRIDGTSDVFGPGVKITITVVDSDHPDGEELGTTTVNNLGDWRFRFTNSRVSILPGGKLTIKSSSGGTLTDVDVSIK